jgi:hypothetical protein
MKTLMHLKKSLCVVCSLFFAQIANAGCVYVPTYTQVSYIPDTGAYLYSVDGKLLGSAKTPTYNHNGTIYRIGAYKETIYTPGIPDILNHEICTGLANQAPSVSNVHVGMNEDTYGRFNLYASDPDAGDWHSFTLVSGPSPAAASMWLEGSQLVVAPHLNWYGDMTISYRASDSKGALSNVATIRVSVYNVNDAPAVPYREMTLDEDFPAAITLNATDIDSPAPSVFQIVSAPNSAHGTATISGNTLTFNPSSNWNGTTSLTYRAMDSAGSWSAPATVNITVRPVNDPPSVPNINFTMDEDSSDNFTLEVSDPDLQFEGDSHTWSIVTAPDAEHGTASISGNQLTFTPTLNWNGTASLTYRVRDSRDVYSNIATVTINVMPVNDAPVASNGALDTAEDTAGTVSLQATDVDAEPLTYSIVDQPNSNHGSVTISNNTATFTPSANWNGDTSFSFRATDPSNAHSNTATITVSVSPVNDTPQVSDLAFSMDEDTSETYTLPVADVDLEFEGDSHTWSIVTAPNAEHGTAAISGDKLTFTPDKDWFGVATVTYRATDNAGAASNVGTVTITVVNVNDAPTVQPLELTTLEDTELRHALVASDIDSDPQFDFELVGLPDVTQGVVGIEGITLVFMPIENWNGETQFSYRARDLEGLWSEPKTIKITVTSVNDAPSATGANIVALEGQQAEPVLPWVTDADTVYGDTHTFEIATQPTNGEVRLDANRLIYTPNPQYEGSDELTIRAIDAGGLSVEGRVTVDVSRFNYAPTDIVPGTVAMFEGVGGTAALTVVDENLWDSHSLEIVTQPEQGEVTLTGLSITYRTDSADDAVVRIKATDKGGLSIEKDISLVMRPAADMIIGRDIILLDDDLRLPAISAQLHDRKGNYALRITDPEHLELLTGDIVLIVDPSAEIGAQVEHRSLTPGEGMRLNAHEHTQTNLESKVGALNAGEAGTTTLYISRADMSGPVLGVPVSMWTVPGQLSSSEGWNILQGVTQTRIAFEANAPSCTLNTNESDVKPRNLLDDPFCLVKWTQMAEESRNTSTAGRLQMDMIGKSVGTQKAIAQAFVYDNEGNQHLIGTYEHELNVLPVSNQVKLNLTPAPDEVYQAIQDVTMVLRAASDSFACDLTNNAAQARRQAENWSVRPSCLVTWTGIPYGLEQATSWSTPQLRGTMNDLSEQTVSWKLSVFTPEGSEVVISEQSHVISVIEPPAIELDLPASPNRLTDTMYSVPAAGGFVGSASISAVPSNIHIVAKSGFDTVRDDVVMNYGRTVQFTTPITATEAPLWTVTPFKIEASYAQLPELITKTELDLLAVPGDSVRPVLLNDERVVVDSDEFIVSTQIMDTHHPQDSYSVAKHGDWDIRLVRSMPGGKFEPLTNWEAINENGGVEFPLDLGDMTNQIMRVFAESRVRSPVPEYSAHRRSAAPLALSVLNGNPLDAELTTLRLLGLAPLRTTFIVTTVDRWESRDIGNVRWEISSDDGATWEAQEPTGVVQQRFSNIFPKGNYLVRAHVSNRNSGAMSITPTVEVIAFEVPEARLEGPRNVFLGDEAVFQINTPDGEPLNTDGMQIEWSEDRGETWTKGGRTYEINSDDIRRIYLQARLKYESAPEHRMAYRNLRTGVAIRAVRPPRVQIIGPRRPEVGKKATWTANMMMPYPNMDMTMDGFFILPDGKVTDSKEVEYTPTQEDYDRERSYITFDGWIDGFEENGGRGLTEHRLIFWSYDWPEWRFQVKASAIYSPADITVTLRNLGIFREFEDLQIDWEVPEGDGFVMTRDSSTLSRSFTLTEPGTYTVAAHVSDGRGFYSYVETDIEVYEPPEWSVDLLWSGDNQHNRAPLKVLVRPKYYGGHPRDRIEEKQYLLNDQQLSSSGDYGRVTLEAGTHDVTMRIATSMGHEAVGQTTITVEENKTPICSIEVKEGRTSWMAQSSCEDEDGRVSGYKWWVNGELQSLGSRAISVPMWRYPEGEPIITVVGVDDSGGESPPVAQK